MPTEKHFKTHEKYLQWYRDYREKNRKKIKKYNREYNKEWRVKNGYSTDKKYKKKYPERIKASQLLNYAVKIGVVKKKPCEFKGCKSIKVQGHHPNYNKPLEVIWLCAKHHKKLHADLSTVKR